MQVEPQKKLPLVCKNKLPIICNNGVFTAIYFRHRNKLITLPLIQTNKELQ